MASSSSSAGDARRSYSKKKRERRLRNAREEKTKKQKRKREEEEEEEKEGGNEEEEEARRERKRLKKKAMFQKMKEKKRQARVEAERIYPPAFSAEQLRDWLAGEYKAALPRIGVPPSDALELRSEHFATRKAIHGVVAVVKGNLPEWRDLLLAPASRAVEARKSPLVLVLTVSTDKAVELIKSVRSLGVKSRVFKLFSRHLKLHEQQQLLESEECKVAVGTPNRVLKLCEAGSMNLRRTRLVCVDTSRDKKLVNIVDSFSTRDDFFRIFHQWMLKRASSLAEGETMRFCIF